MKHQKVYISGPMTSSDSEEQARNVQTFHDCAKLLRVSGCRPVNPANVCSMIQTARWQQLHSVTLQGRWTEDDEGITFRGKPIE